ncbi:TSUP family transporter [uncultured Paludibaculum sp.]|uniref:TSUP family transporter n=1 Tax=uncultured Paludibaculum sp. TaxID=1765020 RepID=UPI002AAACEA3|nr:TSUP family transporter [uncultured Paludibaculum sp.]
MNYLLLLAIGLVAGILGGMFGIGGGLVIIPGLIFLLKMEQFDALGTCLAALIPPVGLLGAYEYYRQGHMNMKYAGLVALGLFIGFYFGAKITLGLSPVVARRGYAIFLVLVAAQMLWTDK